MIEVQKNRFDGEIGKVSLWFDKQSKRFEQMTSSEIEALLSGTDINSVLEDRKDKDPESFLEFENQLDEPEKPSNNGPFTYQEKKHEKTFVQSKKKQLDETINQIMRKMDLAEKRKEKLQSDLIKEQELVTNQNYIAKEQKSNNTQDYLAKEQELDNIQNGLIKEQQLNTNVQNNNFVGSNMQTFETTTSINIFDEIDSGSNEKVIADFEGMFDTKKKPEDSMSSETGYNIFEEIEKPEIVEQQKIVSEKINQAQPIDNSLSNSTTNDLKSMYEVQEPTESQNLSEKISNPSTQKPYNQELLENTFLSNKKEIYSDQHNANSLGNLLDVSSTESKGNFYANDEAVMNYEQVMSEVVHDRKFYNQGNEKSHDKDYWLKKRLENELLEQLTKLHEDEKKN